MKSLQDHLRQYVTARRALGTQLRESAETLSGFIRFLGRKKSKFITIPLALEWSQQSKNVQPATWARKLSMVRPFARWLSVIESRHEVPPPRLLNARHRRPKPHIYSDQEIARLMAAATALKSPRGMKGLTLGTLIGLLAATGLRPGEAAALENRDVDFEAGVLVIRESKFGKSRLVPVHKSVVTAPGKYARARHRTFPLPCCAAFFVSDGGKPLNLGVVRRWFCASYRDTFRLLLKFAAKQYRRQASDLRVEDLDAKLVSAFLKHLEHDRQNSARTRNNRLSAIHAFFGHVSVNEPALANYCQRVLAIPPKRFERGPAEFLSAVEMAALLQAPDTRTWLGKRDHLLLQVALQTGLRNSELISLCRQDVELGTGAHVKCVGKGRKARCTPLRAELAARLSEWIAEQPSGPATPVFPTAKGNAISSDAFQRLVARHIRTAAKTCPSLQKRKVTPHTLRHSLAMNLLQRGVDITVIALWLGHESIETTQTYLHADMAVKEKALARTTNLNTTPKRYRPNDRLLAYLESL